jgi:hypothetical protein
MLWYKVFLSLLNRAGARCLWGRMFYWNESACYFETETKTFPNWNGFKRQSHKTNADSVSSEIVEMAAMCNKNCYVFGYE